MFIQKRWLVKKNFIRIYSWTDNLPTMIFNIFVSAISIFLIAAFQACLWHVSSMQNICSSSNTTRAVVLYWEIQARFHWYWPSLQALCKLKKYLYFPVKNKETFSVGFINLYLFIYFLFFSFFWQLHSNCNLISCPGKAKLL